MTDGKVSDIKAAWQIAFAPGTIVVDDRGYNDYRLFADWTGSGVFFVTRMKNNAQYEGVEERDPPQNRNILKDQTIRLTGTGAQEKCPHLLRRVEAIREDTGETLVFLSNHHGLGASTIAAIYKDRWQVELFFKALKQNLKIKTFVGTSANAVKTQIWTALISIRGRESRVSFTGSLACLQVVIADEQTPETEWMEASNGYDLLSNLL